MWRLLLALGLTPSLYPLTWWTFDTEWRGGAVAAAAFAFAATLLFGLPLLAVMRWRSWLKAWQFALGGAVIGTAVECSFWGFGWNGAGGFFPLFGAAHGLFFWLIGIWRNASFSQRPLSAEAV